MKLEIENTMRSFRILVRNDNGDIVKEAGWHGNEYFEVGGKVYSLLGPYHGMTANQFVLFELKEVARA